MEKAWKIGNASGRAMINGEIGLFVFSISVDSAFDSFKINGGVATLAEMILKR